MIKPFIISADDIKKCFPDYSPQNSSQYHLDSAKLADKIFEYSIKFIPQTVYILGGGTASGKTEYLSEYSKNLKTGGIFLDGTLPSYEGAQIKIKNSLTKERKIEIHFIFPKDLDNAFQAFNNRKRQFSDKHFYRTHSKSRKTIMKVYEEYKNHPNLKIHLIESSFTKNKAHMIFEEIIFRSEKEQIDFLTQFQYTEDEIIKEVLS